MYIYIYKESSSIRSHSSHTRGYVHHANIKRIRSFRKFQYVLFHVANMFFIKNYTNSKGIVV